MPKDTLFACYSLQAFFEIEMFLYLIWAGIKTIFVFNLQNHKLIPLECVIILLPCRNNRDHFHYRNYLGSEFTLQRYQTLKPRLLLPHISVQSVW